MINSMLSFAFTLLLFTSAFAQQEIASSFELSKEGVPYFPQISPLESTPAPMTSTKLAGTAQRNTTQVELKAGTLIEFQSMESIPWERATTGRRIRFKVYRDVLVDGQILIAANTVAMGVITDIIEATPNSAEAVYIEIERVPAVDGQMIDLSGIQEKISTRISGTSVNIPARTLASGYVLNNRTITID